VGGLILGNYLSAGIMDYSFLQIVDIKNLDNSIILGSSLIPSILMIIIAILLI